jgi:hypothetical protein
MADVIDVNVIRKLVTCKKKHCTEIIYYINIIIMIILI